MNGQSTKDYRYWITYLLDDLSVKAEFKPGLLHITVIPWFVLESDEEHLIQSYEAQFSDLKAFGVEVGDVTMFGPKKDIAVNLLRNAEEFQELHWKAMEWFNEISARWAVQHPHVEQQYIPHIRKREGNQLIEGKIFNINRLELVRARRQEDENRTVAAKVRFDG